MKRGIVAFVLMATLGVSVGCGSKGNYQDKNGYENQVSMVISR